MRGIHARVVAIGVAVALIGSPVATASAQQTPPMVAVVVGNPADLATWGFAPTVPIGQPVTWVNQGAQPHSVTFQGVAWDTGIMDPGAAATLVLDAPGLYSYLCTLHPTMVGTVVVSEDPAVSAPAMSIFEADPVDVLSWGYAVSIPVGQSVTWWNADDQVHTATAADGAWDTGQVDPGNAAAFPFDLPGLYAYVCSPHPWMKGFLQVT